MMPERNEESLLSPNETPRMSRRVWAGLLIIILLGAAVRLHDLGKTSFWYDEAVIADFATRDGWASKLFSTEYSNDPPLFPIVAHFWAKICECVPWVTTGSVAHDASLRMLPLLMNLSTIPLIFVLGLKVVNNYRVGLLAAFFYAINPFLVYYAQDYRNYSFHVLLATAALLCIVWALDTGYWQWWVAWLLTVVVALYNNFFMVWVVVGFNALFVALMPWHWRRLREWILVNLLVILFFLPGLQLMLVYSKFFESARENWYPPPGLHLLFLTFKAFFAGYSPNPKTYYAITVIAAGLTGLGMWRLRRRLPALLILIVPALVPILSTALYFRTTRFPYYTHRLMIFSSVPLVILAAIGVGAISKRWARWGVVVMFAGLSGLALSDVYANRLHPVWEHRLAVLLKIDNRQASRFIGDAYVPGDYVIHRVRYSQYPFRYYLDHLQVPQRVVALTQQSRMAAIQGYPYLPMLRNCGTLPERIEPVIDSAKRVWYVKTFWEPDYPDPEGVLIRAWLDEHAFRTLWKPFEGLTVFQYQQAPSIRSDAQMMVLADDGNTNLPYYLFPSGAEGDDAGRAWRKTFADMLAIPGDDALTTGFQLAFGLSESPEGAGSVLLDPAETGKTLRGAFPLKAADGLDCQFSLRNGTDAARTVKCTVLDASAIVEPMSFTREELLDTWQPQMAFDGGPPMGVFNVPILNAHPTVPELDGRAVYRDLSLAAGRYGVFAWIIELPKLPDVQRAEARFTVLPLDAERTPGAAIGIGATDGVAPEGKGWAWRRIGELNWPGGRFRLRVSVHKPEGLDNPYFDLGRVLFMADGRTPQEAETFDVALDPGETETFSRTLTPSGPGGRWIAIDAFDPGLRQFRQISCYVEGVEQ